MAAPARLGLFKRAWNEIPEVMGSSFMGLIGIGLGIAGGIIYYQKDGDNRKYKMNYTVITKDDPRAAAILKEKEEMEKK